MASDRKHQTVAHYVVLKLIGKGSYGQVHLVKNRRDKRQYVMKNIPLSSLTDDKERAAALREAQLLSSMAHPNIVAYKESLQDSSGILHIIMAYCEGGDLSSRLKACKGVPLAEDQVIEWFVQITLALQYLHERHILHRDLKTSNIFLSKNDIIKVGDLGIARVLEGSCDLAHTVIGTPFFMSPELFSNQPYSYKSDVWSLGCCVYEMASLKHAFSATSIHALMAQVVQGKLPPMPHRYSNELCDLIRSMLLHDAKQRPSVNQLLRLPFVKHNIRLFLERATIRKNEKNKQQVLTCKEDSKIPQHKELITPSRNDKQGGTPDNNSYAKAIQPHPSAVIVISRAREKRRLSKQQTAAAAAAAANRVIPELHDSKVDNNMGVLDIDGGRDHTSSDVTDVGRDHTNSDVTDGGRDHTSSDVTDGGRDHMSSDVTDGGRDHMSSNVTDGGRDHMSSDVTDGRGDNIVEQGEYDSFLTLLNNTLQLLPSAKDDSDTPTEEDHVSTMRLGRLNDRIVRLRRELMKGLGEELFYKSRHLLDDRQGDLEEIEEHLQQLLGAALYKQFGAKLQELKLYEETLTSKA